MAAMLTGARPVADFTFTDRDGQQRSFFEIIASAQPDATVYLLLFDPDCDECRSTIASLSDNPKVNAGLKDATVKVVAVYPVDAPPEASDPNLIRYRQVCRELPQEWIVGIDDGSIFEGDFYQWETLPLLIRYDKGDESTCRCSNHD